MKKLVLLLLFAAPALAQVPLQDDYSNIGDINPADIEQPEEAPSANPAPPFICEESVEPTCSPVNDWWCWSDAACAGWIEVSFAEVYAPGSLSPLGFAQPWYDHWKASLDNLAAHQHELHLWRTGQMTYEPEAPDLGCDVETDFRDGPGGALWKPVSENTRKPVFLLPGSYKHVRDIDVFGADGQRITGGSFRTCCPNGGRAHFDVPVSGGRLEDYAPITVRLGVDGGYECRIVENPEDRVD